MKQPGNEETEKHDARREGVHAHAVVAKGCQKAGAGVDADRVNKQDQAEFTNEMQEMMVDPCAIVGEQQAGKQDTDHAEADFPDFEFAEQNADKGRKADPENGSGDACAKK